MRSTNSIDCGPSTAVLQYFYRIRATSQMLPNVTYYLSLYLDFPVRKVFIKMFDFDSSYWFFD